MTPFLAGPTGRPLLLDNADFLTTSPTSRKAPAAASTGPPPVASSPCVAAGPPDSLAPRRLGGSGSEAHDVSEAGPVWFETGWGKSLPR